uniref:Uncharacterized protein n=1 Tax=Arundo donax TaxID=35708 RepID=A0A0A9AAK7_ARUDO
MAKFTAQEVKVVLDSIGDLKAPGPDAIKLDISKAYDGVEWRFLREMMIKLGFHEDWVRNIMKCVSRVAYRIKVNGVYTEAIISERGLRQGILSRDTVFLFVQRFFFIIIAQG